MGAGGGGDDKTDCQFSLIVDSQNDIKTSCTDDNKSGQLWAAGKYKQHFSWKVARQKLLSKK
jgi:hypothetical protein